MDKIDKLDLILTDKDKGIYLENTKARGVYIKDEVIASIGFDWVSLFPALTNNLVDKNSRGVNGCAILNFSSLLINLKRNGISNLFFKPHTLDLFTVSKGVISNFSLHRDGDKIVRYIQIIFASCGDTSLNLFTIKNGIHSDAGSDAKIIDVTVNGPEASDYKGFNVVILLFDDKA